MNNETKTTIVPEPTKMSTEEQKSTNARALIISGFFLVMLIGLVMYEIYSKK